MSTPDPQAAGRAHAYDLGRRAAQAEITPAVLAQAIAAASGHPGMVRDATRMLAERTHAELGSALGWGS